ncbi:TetR family transcriptional regulator [Pseudonocardia hispaniensis]|uniref:TetR family transcriptional regulator n=1 Tax=Pseudonocardia hispaniensis TaxID=904933 RepID=A0ABW1IXT5_9PSEU
MAEPGTETAARRRGRRRAGEDTRAALLAAARVEFVERGFDGATVRRIAERAGVDPAMVNHWFGGKEQLFVSSLEIPVDVETIQRELLSGDRDELGTRIVTMFLRIWDRTGGGPLAALIRSVAGHEAAARMMREFVGKLIIGRIVARVAPDQVELRAALVGSQVIGLGMVRYVLELEPLASADHPTVIAAVAPNLQRYLTGPLDAAGPRVMEP